MWAVVAMEHANMLRTETRHFSPARVMSLSFERVQLRGNRDISRPGYSILMKFFILFLVIYEVKISRFKNLSS